MESQSAVRFRRILVPVLGANQRCPLCHGLALPGQVLVACGACLTTQHRECFEETRSCTTLGCRNLRRPLAMGDVEEAPDPKGTEHGLACTPSRRRWKQPNARDVAAYVGLAGILHVLLVLLILLSPPAHAAEREPALRLHFETVSERQFRGCRLPAVSAPDAKRQTGSGCLVPEPFVKPVPALSPAPRPELPCMWRRTPNAPSTYCGVGSPRMEVDHLGGCQGSTSNPNCVEPGTLVPR